MAEYKVLNASEMKEIADNKKNEEKKNYDKIKSIVEYLVSNYTDINDSINKISKIIQQAAVNGLYEVLISKEFYTKITTKIYGTDGKELFTKIKELNELICQYSKIKYDEATKLNNILINNCNEKEYIDVYVNWNYSTPKTYVKLTRKLSITNDNSTITNPIIKTFMNNDYRIEVDKQNNLLISWD
jgi:hypothetical protein